MLDKKIIEKINRAIGQLIKAGERDIARKYAHTLTEIRKTMAKQYEKYEQGGKLSLDDMLKYDRLRKLLAEINWHLKAHYAEIEKQMEKILKGAYTEGFYLTAHAVEVETMTKLGYSAVRPETLTAMLANPVAGLTLNARLERQRSNIIYSIQQQVTQGLQRNETYATMAKRLKAELEGDAVKAMRIVRTEGHRTQESAKHDAMDHANKNGVIMVKQWNSLEDERVRHRPKNKADHRKLNNQKLPMDDNFNDGLSSGPAPGQLGAAASDINCRCFLTYSVERIEKPQYKELENMSFDQWKNERLANYTAPKAQPKPTTPPPIPKPKTAAVKPTKPKPKANPMQNMYDVEDKIRSNATETGIVFDPQGNEVWRQKGNSNSVDISDAISKGALKGNVLTHNHPRGSSFSDADILVLSMHDLGAIRAVSTNHNYHATLSDDFKKVDKNARHNMLKNMIYVYDQQVQGEFGDAIRKNKMSVADANLNHWHEIWSRLQANEGWINYTRERVK